MYVWFIGLNHSKYRFPFHAVYIGIMNGIRKLAFHAARYNRQKYLDSDVRSRPLQSVRRAFFFVPDGCNIAPGTDPAMETVTEDFQNFSQRFSGADFCCRQTTASCTFVCRKVFRHTKGARSARLGGVPESRHLNYQTDDNHEKEDRTPDNDRSQSPQV